LGIYSLHINKAISIINKEQEIRDESHWFMCTENPLARFQCWWATSQISYLIGQGSHHGDEANKVRSDHIR